MTKISVIIPVYNVEKYLDKCVSSVIEQDMPDLEIIICDDASNDGSLNIIENYKKKDSRIKLIAHKENQGLSVSRNDGMEIASGEYIFFLDSDDYIKQNVLTILYQKIKNVDTDVLFFGYEEHGVGNQDNIKRYRHKRIYPNVENGPDFFCGAVSEGNMCVTSWSAIYKNQFLKENNIKFKPHIIHEDDLFYYEVLMKANSVTSVDDFCYEYIRRNNSLSLSQRIYHEKIESLCFIIAEIINLNKNNGHEYKYCTNEYISSLNRQLISYYKELNYFSWNRLPFTDDEELILRLATGAFYNGFFTYKLPDNVISEIKKYKDIIIYGAGKVGVGLKELLSEYDIHIRAFVQTNLKDTEKKNVSGIPLKSINEIVNDDGIVLLIASKNYSVQMIEIAKQMKFKNIIDVSKYI